MARGGKKSRKPSKASVKAAADRAEAKSKGEEPKVTATPLEPGVVTEGSAAPGPHPGGRPSDYKPEFCDSARKLAAGGATIAEIAEELGVSRMTVHRWMAVHDEFRDSIKLAGAEADDRVEYSLFERAVGYSYNATKMFCSEGVVTTQEYIEHVPPSEKAIHMWLLNRRPKEWKNVQRVEHTGPGGAPVEVSFAGDIAQARRVAFALGQAALRLQARTEASDAEVVDK